MYCFYRRFPESKGKKNKIVSEKVLKSKEQVAHSLKGKKQTSLHFPYETKNNIFLSSQLPLQENFHWRQSVEQARSSRKKTLLRFPKY